MLLFASLSLCLVVVFLLYSLDIEAADGKNYSVKLECFSFTDLVATLFIDGAWIGACMCVRCVATLMWKSSIVSTVFLP